MAQKPHRYLHLALPNLHRHLPPTAPNRTSTSRSAHFFLSSHRNPHHRLHLTSSRRVATFISSHQITATTFVSTFRLAQLRRTMQKFLFGGCSGSGLSDSSCGYYQSNISSRVTSTCMQHLSLTCVVVVKYGRVRLTFQDA
jgi:hypothetical protein